MITSALLKKRPIPLADLLYRTDNSFVRLTIQNDSISAERDQPGFAPDSLPNGTASVKARLVADKLSNFTRIDVDTVNAVVSLTGLVESEFEKRRAEDIASLVDGVEKIVNDLQVQKAPAPRPE